jgi:hypothetical protein
MQEQKQTPSSGEPDTQTLQHQGREPRPLEVALEGHGHLDAHGKHRQSAHSGERCFPERWEEKTQSFWALHLEAPDSRQEAMTNDIDKTSPRTSVAQPDSQELTWTEATGSG